MTLKDLTNEYGNVDVRYLPESFVWLPSEDACDLQRRGIEAAEALTGFRRGDRYGLLRWQPVIQGAVVSRKVAESHKLRLHPQDGGAVVRPYEGDDEPVVIDRVIRPYEDDDKLVAV